MPLLGETDPIAQGEIFWITIPKGSGREQHGRRPCIVMSRQSLNSGNPVIVVPMTSETRRANSHNILIPRTEIIQSIDSQTAIVDSVALCNHMFTVDKRKFEERLGKLSLNAILATQLGLSYLFDIR